MFKSLALATALAISAAVPAFSADLTTPTGDVILTVTGNIKHTNFGDAAVFDLDMLDAIDGRETVTETPWYPEAQSFSGVLIGQLLDQVGAEGTSVKVTALNGFSGVIPMEEIKEYPVILASRINGDELSIRDKGPLFVIYPFDEFPDLHDEAHFGRSIWQVESITVE